MHPLRARASGKEGMFSFTGQERDIDRTKATLIGFASIVFWSALVGFIKSVSDRLGAVGGAAVIHTVGSLMPGCPDRE